MSLEKEIARLRVMNTVVGRREFEENPDISELAELPLRDFLRLAELGINIYSTKI